MSKPKLRWWRCPLCGIQKLAPSRPRNDDARRYCLRCTDKTGRLVRRTCPALERARQRSAELAAARRERLRSAAHQKAATASPPPADRRHHVAGYDLVSIGRIMWSTLLGLSSEFIMEPRSRDFPTVNVRRRARAGVTASAKLKSHSVTLTFPVDYPAKPKERALALGMLLHELCHLVHGTGQLDSAGREQHHDERFNTILAAAAKQLWGVTGLTVVRGYGTSDELERELELRERAAETAG